MSDASDLPLLSLWNSTQTHTCQFFSSCTLIGESQWVYCCLHLHDAMIHPYCLLKLIKHSVDLPRWWGCGEWLWWLHRVYGGFSHRNQFWGISHHSLSHSDCPWQSISLFSSLGVFICLLHWFSCCRLHVFHPDYRCSMKETRNWNTHISVFWSVICTYYTNSSNQPWMHCKICAATSIQHFIYWLWKVLQAIKSKYYIKTNGTGFGQQWTGQAVWNVCSSLQEVHFTSCIILPKSPQLF